MAALTTSLKLLRTKFIISSCHPKSIPVIQTCKHRIRLGKTPNTCNNKNQSESANLNQGSCCNPNPDPNVTWSESTPKSNSSR